MATEVNKETGKEYELKQDPFEQYPHLAALKKEAKTIKAGSLTYWKLRCRYLEKTIDETYSISERNNCRTLYKILANRER